MSIIDYLADFSREYAYREISLTVLFEMNDKRRRQLLKEVPSIQIVHNNILTLTNTNIDRIISDSIALSEFEDALIISSKKLSKSIFIIGDIFATDAVGYDSLPEGIKGAKLGDSLLESSAKLLEVINALEDAQSTINKIIDKIEESTLFKPADLELIDVISNLDKAIQIIDLYWTPPTNPKALR